MIRAKNFTINSWQNLTLLSLKHQKLRVKAAFGDVRAEEAGAALPGQSASSVSGSMRGDVLVSSTPFLL